MVREVLCYSREKRPMELLTLTADIGRTPEKEKFIDALFPESKLDPNTRPFVFDKPTIFLSARVHPGETPASYVLDGIMQFLLAGTDQSQILLEKFVFKIIPILNPDGVYRGYFRLDTLA
jgi:cytosolic carboxypeptidase protein 5